MRFQIGAFVVLTFLIFVRYLDFMGLSKDDLLSLSVTRGTWPSWLNALFNGMAHYLFIASIVVIFIPIFAGKLSLIRDVYAAPFFRPFARTNFTLACFQGLLLQFIFFSQTQAIKFEHKNFMFLFCGILILGYLMNFLFSMLLEWPFRTMAKLVFQAPRRMMLKLKDDLAKELNTNDDIFDEEFEVTEAPAPIVIERPPTKALEQTIKGFKTAINDEDSDMSISFKEDSAKPENRIRNLRLFSIKEENNETEHAESRELSGHQHDPY